MLQVPNGPPPMTWQSPQQTAVRNGELGQPAQLPTGTNGEGMQYSIPGNQPAQPQNLAGAIQGMPSPRLTNYFNGGAGTRVGPGSPVLRGMPQTVQPPPLMGPNPQGNVMAGYGNPGALIRPQVR